MALVLDIASAADTPDSVRDVALRRVGDLPRKQVVDRLFGLFSNDNWKIRWVAAELVLKMSETNQLGEFMNKLASVKHMAITEPLRYGALIGEMKGKDKPEEARDKYIGSGNSTAARSERAGLLLRGYGTKARALEGGIVTPATRTKVPECTEGDTECEWKCAVGEGKSQEKSRTITTVGEFVQFCVKPAMEKRDTDQEGRLARASDEFRVWPTRTRKPRAPSSVATRSGTSSSRWRASSSAPSTT